MISRRTYRICSALLVAAGACGTAETEPGAAAGAATATVVVSRAHRLQTDNLSGESIRMVGTRSVAADPKYPCLSSFSACVPLNTVGDTDKVQDLCPSTDQPVGTWSFAYQLFADTACSTASQYVACPGTVGEFLQAGTHTNVVVCTAQCAGALGNYVWNDTNSNGIQDPGEPGLNGIRVRLLSGTGQYLAATTTANGPSGNAGYYQFVGLCANSYQAAIDTTTVPSNLVPTTSNAPGSTTANDSNGSPAPVTLLTDSASDQTIDFGYRISACTGSIGDWVWYDVNRNGIQDSGEPGLDGVTLELTDVNDVTLATTVTAQSGSVHGWYTFNGLCATSSASPYTVVVHPDTLPAGFTPTTSLAPGSTTANDSNGSPTDLALATDTTADATVDFGYVFTESATVDVSCSGFAVTVKGGLPYDASGSVAYSITATPTTGAPVTLSGTMPLTQTTLYGFSASTAQTWFAFNGLVLNGTYSFTGTATLRNGSGATLRTYPLSFQPTQLTCTPGCTGSIGDVVWNDANRNGVQDSGEAGIANVTVQLRNPAGTVLASAATNGSGYYTFNNLCAGTYTVAINTATLASTYLPTFTSVAGSNSANDSNGSPASVALATSTSADPTIDFGYIAGRTFTISSSKMTTLKSINPGDYLWGGYEFQINSAHTATTLIVKAVVTIPITCKTGTCTSNCSIVIDLGTSLYPVPASSSPSAWILAGDSTTSHLGWMGSTQAPNLCQGGTMIGGRTTFTATTVEAPQSYDLAGNIAPATFKFHAGDFGTTSNCSTVDTCKANWSKQAVAP